MFESKSLARMMVDLWQILDRNDQSFISLVRSGAANNLAGASLFYTAAEQEGKGLIPSKLSNAADQLAKKSLNKLFFRKMIFASLYIVRQTVFRGTLDCFCIDHLSLKISKTFEIFSE